ncbi:MAG: thioredoxin family protein [Erythrobacter sp.]|jgi:hypothetical protein|nr:thioredoxin family protein [Erythrobacter sp.]
MIKPILAGLLGGVLLVGCAALTGDMAQSSEAQHGYPEAESFTVSDDAMADVDAALARAAASDKRVLLVMGANWCHDSRALAGWLATERFAGLVDQRYELVFVNIGMPQSGDGHNLEVARRFGIEELEGTPAVMVLSAAGEPVNADTAISWRNAASREEDAIYDELALLAEAPPPAAR